MVFRLLIISSYQGRLSVILCDSDTERDPARHPRPCAHFVSGQAGLIEQYLNEIVMHSQPRGNKLARHGLLVACLAELLEVLHSPPADSTGHHKIVQCRRLIRDRISDPSLSVPRLAQWVQCSSDYLSRLFHEHMGVRLTKYINQQRIAHACQLLGGSSLNISEISAACGYSDAGYFTRVFRKETGKTPKLYRRLPKPRA